MKYTTPKKMSLWEALQLLSPDSSKSTLRQWLHSGRVLVDDVPIKKAATEIEEGLTITLAPVYKTLPKGILILYEDSNLVVIDKPKGLLSVATNFEAYQTAHAILKYHYQKNVYVVHRIDQDTSGVMIFALSEKASGQLKIQFAHHSITRSYAAIVEGTFTKKKGTWESYLYEDEYYKVHTTTDPLKGEKAVSHYQVEKIQNGYTWLTIALETGRKNQIRVHCKEAGHPIAGDTKYGGKKGPHKRLCLHAHLLAFDHPITGKRMTFESPIPWSHTSCTKTHSG